MSCGRGEFAEIACHPAADQFSRGADSATALVRIERIGCTEDPVRPNENERGNRSCAGHQAERAATLKTIETKAEAEEVSASEAFTSALAVFCSFWF